MGNAWHISLIKEVLKMFASLSFPFSVGIRRQEYAGMEMGIIRHNV